MAYVESRIPSGNQTERRWEKIKAALLEQDGGITLERAEEILESRRSRGLFLEHMDEVVAAIKCLAEQPEVIEVEEVEVEPEVAVVEPDPPLPQSSTPDIDITSLRAYFHGGETAASNAVWKISEDDWWEAELIIHYKSNQALPDLRHNLCVNTNIWGGPDHWHNGPITLPGFTDYADLTDPVLSAHPLHGGIWRCTGAVDDSPHVTRKSSDANGVEFVYRARVRTRDNDVVENDFSIADELEFSFANSSTGVWSGKLKFRPEVTLEPDRSWWRMKDDVVAWPERGARSCLGDGQRVWIFARDRLTCKNVSNPKWRARFTNPNGSVCGSREARADMAEDEWLPDRCFPEKEVVKIPPTPSNTDSARDNTELPVIEEDDVSWVTLKLANNKWTVSLSKPVMVTDGTRIVGGEPFLDNINSAHGLTLTMSGIPGNTSSYKQVHLLIPAENGIVLDKDYPLADLKRIGNLAGWHPPEGSESFGESCQSTEKARTEMRNNMNFRLPGGFHGKYALSSTKINTFVRNNTLSSRTGDKKGLEMDLPPNGSDLCR